MKSSDIDFAFHLTNCEGWQGETKDVFKDFFTFDPDGCFIGEIGSKRIGMCIAIKYQQNGFIGELIVDNEYRGNGFGRQLFFHSIDYLKSNKIENIFLDGDLSAVPIYEKSGLRKICKSLRFVGKQTGKKSELVRKANPDDLPQIKEIDIELFGDDRSFSLERRLLLYPNLCFVAEIDRKITGYIMARPGVGVLSVGPWASLDGNDCAQKLLERMAHDVKGQTMRIGALDSNLESVRLMKSLDTFSEQTPSLRMAIGNSDRLGQHDGLYAIGSAASG